MVYQTLFASPSTQNSPPPLLFLPSPPEVMYVSPRSSTNFYPQGGGVKFLKLCTPQIITLCALSLYSLGQIFSMTWISSSSFHHWITSSTQKSAVSPFQIFSLLKSWFKGTVNVILRNPSWQCLLNNGSLESFD